jgi:hypothetical protein
VDLNAKPPAVDSSAEWPQAAASSDDEPRRDERRRSTERHRVRRRSRKPSAVRSKIRLRMWLACTGALLVMAIMLYLAIGREPHRESGFQLVGGAAVTASLDAAVGVTRGAPLGFSRSGPGLG